MVRLQCYGSVTTRKNWLVVATNKNVESVEAGWRVDYQFSTLCVRVCVYNLMGT